MKIKNNFGGGVVFVEITKKEIADLLFNKKVILYTEEEKWVFQIKQ